MKALKLPKSDKALEIDNFETAFKLAVGRKAISRSLSMSSLKSSNSVSNSQEYKESASSSIISPAIEVRSFDSIEKPKKRFTEASCDRNGVPFSKNTNVYKRKARFETGPSPKAVRMS